MHLMIDLETLALVPNAVVTQLGWAAFDFDGKECHGAGLIHLDPEEQMRRGRSVNWSTVSWWLKQEDAARNAMANVSRMNVVDGLKSFVDNIQSTFGWENIKGVWSNGPSFDQTIMEDLFFCFEVKIPWAYNAGRDLRTMAMLTPNVPKVIPLTAHNAMDDAIAQAVYVQNSFAALQVRK